MKLWEPKSCCCCCTPRVGTLVLGYMGVIFAVLEFLGMIRSVLLGRQELENSCRNRGMSGQSLESCYSSVVAGMWVGIVTQLLWAVVCILLILGTNKRKSQLMLPYMILQTIMLIVLTLALVIGSIFLMYFKVWIAVLIMIPLGGLFIFLSTYFLLVVRVHYKEIKEDNEPSGMEFAPVPYKV